MEFTYDSTTTVNRGCQAQLGDRGSFLAGRGKQAAMVIITSATPHAVKTQPLFGYRETSCDHLGLKEKGNLAVEAEGVLDHSNSSSLERRVLCETPPISCPSTSPLLKRSTVGRLMTLYLAAVS